MEMMEIVLLIAGGIIFILSFFIPDKKNASDKGGAEGAKTLAEEELRGLVSREMDSIRTHVDDVVEEAVSYAMEKTERSLERLSNEKIMAVNEYSDTVLAEIHKNHEEAMFLYDMLNNKHINLKNTVSEVNRTVKEAEETVMNFQRLAPETLSASEERILNRAERSQGPGTGFVMERPVRTETGMQRPGAEKSGIERAGAGAFGTESAGTENTGIKKSGTENTGTARAGAGAAGAPKAGAEYSGTVRNGTDPLGQGSPETGNPGAQNLGINHSGIANAGIQDAGTQTPRAEEDIVQKTQTERSGLERLGAPSDNLGPGKVSFMDDVDDQGRNNNERILALFQEGRSTVAIAKELGLGVGEVKLVIDLFKNQ